MFVLESLCVCLKSVRFLSINLEFFFGIDFNLVLKGVGYVFIVFFRFNVDIFWKIFEFKFCLIRYY